MVYLEEDLNKLRNGEMSAQAFDEKYGQGESQNALAPPVKKEEVQDDGESLLSEIIDVPAQVIGGIAEAIDNTGELTDEVGNDLRTSLTDKDETSLYKDSVVDKSVDYIRDELIGEPKNAVSGFTRGVSQFVAGWFTGGKILQGVKFGTKVVQGGKTVAKTTKKLKDAKNTSEFVKIAGKNIAKASVKGAVVDAVVFDSHDQRLADLVENHAPWLSTPITQYLQSDENDTFYEGRLKNAMEGVLLGNVLDSFLTILRYRKFSGQNKLKQMVSEEQIQKDLEFIEESNIDLKQAVEELDNGTARGTLKEEDILSPEAKEQTTASRKGNEVAQENIDSRNLKNEEVDKIADDMAEPTMGHDQKSFDLLVDQIDAFKRGEIDAIDIDAGFNPKIFKNGVDSDLLVFDRVFEGLRKSGKLKEGVENQAMVERLARLTVEKSPADAIEQINTLSKAVKNSTEVIAQSVILAQSLANAVPRIARIIKAQQDPLNKIVLAKQDKRVAERLGISIAEAKAKRVEWTKTDLRKLIIALAQVSLDGNWIKKQFARGTAFGNKKVGVADISLDKLSRELENMSKFKGDEDGFYTRLGMLDLPPEGIMKILNYVLKGKSWDVANEIWINFLLSSPKTHLVNMLSNGIMVGLRPTEKYVYGVLSGNREMREEALDIFAGLFHSFRDANKYAFKSLKNEESVLDPGMTKTEGVEQALGNSVVGKTLRGATRLLTAEDEWFKQINYRAKLFANINRVARLKGLNKKKTMFDEHGKPTSEYNEFVKEQFKLGFDEKFRFTNIDAMEYARELTFTKELDPRSFSGGVNQILKNNPGARQIVPFLRTPVNIMHSGLDRIPVFGIFRKQYRDKLRGKGNYTAREIQDARSKATMGMVVLGLGGMLASQGMITGRGPEDYELRKVLFRTGWRPYSLKIGDKYISYARLEPLSMVLGTLADFIEISQDIPEHEKANLEDQLFLSMLSTFTTNTVSTSFRALTKNLLSKTYMKGVSDILNAVMEEDEYKQKQVFNSFVTSRVIPSVIRNMNKDPYYRETRNSIDAVASQVWWASKNLDPRYNFLGEKDVRPGSVFSRLINPIDVSNANDDLIWGTLTELEHKITPIDEMHKGIDLTLYRNKKTKQTAYTWVNEYVAKDDKLRKKLTQIINSTEFKGKTKNGYFEGTKYIGGKVDMINDAVELIRSDAFKRLRQQRGFVSEGSGITLDRAITNKKNNRLNWKNSRTSKDIENFLKVTQ